MPSPLDFLWAGIGWGVLGRHSITLVNRWLRAFIVAITAAICASKSAFRVLESLVIEPVILVWSTATSLLMNFVRSSLISAVIWSQSAFAFWCW